MELWLIFIIIHTLLALTAFVAGLLMLHRPVIERRPWLMTLFLFATIAMTIFVVLATVSHWYSISVGERVAFGLLPLLALYMIYRIVKARTYLQNGQWNRYIDGVGFALISYFDGFIIVAMLDLKAPAWAVATVAVLAVLLGTRYVNRAKTTLR